MKYQWVLIFLLSVHFSSAQEAGVLYLSGSKLKGDCENRFFTGFEIELDTFYTNIDRTTLFGQFPRVGAINFKNKRVIPTEFTITDRAGYPQIMFRFRTSYYTFDDLIIEPKLISFTVDEDPEVPVTEKDVQIVRLAQKLLSDENQWHKNDDRVCTDDLINNAYSLYCALRISSLEVEGHYNHRNAALQKLRHLIEDKYPSRKWQHRLMDYNNMEETSHHDILRILDEMETSFNKTKN